MKLEEVVGYLDEQHTLIRAVFDGKEINVPDVGGNRHRKAIADWEAQGNAIPAYAPPAPPVPDAITVLQMVTTAVADGWFTEAEGRTWLQRNGVPAIVQATIDALPADQQFAVEAPLYGMAEAYRSDPTTFAMVKAALQSANEAEPTDQEVIDARDDFFRRAAQV